ncbi:glycerophosphodiester phosphodiesterase family protein [Bacillus sp. JCM 19034]|uniref:glycerophosphodiester phosphodiesterase family protein n=1 Tax=Bacillus sp. JCM 19034 TaxID=1481928 RepID=UPI0007849ACB|nr:glycerophosphodiester phosphodiesterase family protein [Bacillus sp. JCM 19034]
MIENLYTNTSISIAAHRGYKSAYPENTLLAFKEAMDQGADMIEFDLRMSKDKHVMIIHDETLDRTTNGSGEISNYMLAELKELDAGSWFAPPFEGLKIPTLIELCDLLKSYPNVYLNVEVKKSVHAKEVVDKTVELLKSYNYLSRCVFTCFDADIIAYMYETYNLKTQGFLEEVMENFEKGSNGTYSKMWAIGISMDLLTPSVVKKCKEIGLRVGCYCPDNYKQVYYALGCDVSLFTCNNLKPAMSVRRQNVPIS